ncbi:MAG: hypothetical protein RBT63_03270 [Bdellovibrionales bacterium]|jgi:hypothetical protein|nr:hypothetical protein [Bdellovibrionales bacterium]
MDAPLLSDLLEKDSHPQPLGLPDVFGDQSLLVKNRIFRAIRTHASQLGYRYSNQRPENYEALPFTTLEEILAHKEIPIVHNKRALEIVAEKVPSATWLDIADGFRRCFAFHESCHAVARAAFTKTTDASSAGERVLRIMLEESFTNTCELFGILDCEDLADLAIYEANSYTALWEAKEFVEAVHSHAAPAFTYVLLHYLRANFLAQDEPSQEENELMHSIAGLENTSIDREALETLASFAYTLDENFRLTTSRLHLRLLGLPADLDTRSPIQELTRSQIKNLQELVASVTSSYRDILAE